MFDRKAYMKEYYGKRYQRRKAEGRCTACGEILTDECTTLLCTGCRIKSRDRSNRYLLNQMRKMIRQISNTGGNDAKE